MSTPYFRDSQKKFEIPGRITFQDGNGDLPTLEITTPLSQAEIYLQGATVTRFQKTGEPPLLFLSQLSRFEPNHPIRGGIPVIFPWFGPREGEPAHGFARVKPWELREITQLGNDGLSVRLKLPECVEAATVPAFTAEYLVTLTETLAVELVITNTSPDQEFTFENCLHTYFTVGSIHEVGMSGLKGVTCLDKADNFARKTETADELRITRETDRIYLNTTGPVEILDRSLNRRIHIEKQGSASTVVWNPWIAKAQQMPDFGNDEYLQMLCVESGNVAQNAVTLAPGGISSLKVTCSTKRL